MTHSKSMMEETMSWHTPLPTSIEGHFMVHKVYISMEVHQYFSMVDEQLYVLLTREDLM
jgi:hypothetical protein